MISFGRALVAAAPCIAAVATAEKHIFRKLPVDAISLVAGLGIAGDAHSGVYVQHLHDKRIDPTRQNLRQVHLIEMEVIEELKALGSAIGPGDLGENVTTRHLRLVELSAGTLMRLGSDAVVKITGLRAPCGKIDRLQPGLRHAVTFKRNGYAAMRGTVMAVVITSGVVLVNDMIRVREPADASSLRPV